MNKKETIKIEKYELRKLLEELFCCNIHKLKMSQKEIYLETESKHIDLGNTENIKKLITYFLDNYGIEIKN